MSHAGRRRAPHARPTPRPRLAARPSAEEPRPPARLGARTTAALTVLTLAAAVAVPATLVPDEADPAARPVRGAAAGAAMRTATDQIRAREWHLTALRAPKAWRYSKGAGVTVAVLDTGVDKGHPDLTGRVLNGPDLTGGARRPGGRYWGLHGTSMASIIAGHGHGPGLAQGMLGVAPQSRVLSVRVTLENNDPLRKAGAQATTGSRDAVALGIRYAVDHGAGIINMSLGGGRQSYNGNPAQESAIKYALGKGVVLIASAGNDGSGADRKNFPAAYPGVIAVGALDRRLHLWKDSNRNSHAAVCAPGVDIVSADASNGYVVGTGTSASSAMVAGVAALIRSRYPRLSPDEVRQALITGSPARRGHPTGSPNCAGTVDAVRALVAANALNKTSRGPVEPAPSPSATPEPAADSPAKDSGVLLPLVLGGGGVLVLIGLVLGWRQRRRPDEEFDDVPPPDDDLPDDDLTPGYRLPGAPSEPAAMPAPGAVPPGPVPPIAPVNTAPFQSSHPYAGPGMPPPPGGYPDVPATHVQGPAPVPEPVAEAEPYVPEHALPPDQWDEAPWDTGAPLQDGIPPGPSRQPPVMAGELRPFVPGEFPVGDFPVGGLNGELPGPVEGFSPNGRHLREDRPANGHDHGNGRHLANGHNGHDPRNGHDFGAGQELSGGVNGTAPGGAGPADDAPGLDDEEWERFRRSALEGPGVPEAEFPTAPQDGPTGAPLPPAVPPPPTVPPPTVPPSATPPSAAPPSAAPPSAAPPSAAPPSATPPSAVPPTAAPPSVVPPVEDASAGGLPATPPVPPVPPAPPAGPGDDDPHNPRTRRPYSSSDDDDYRPPWW
ncbi:S8 family peptidase [Actinomadura opuntiae]|uniref:S8 family peptidase n=1 Tax=Actinomadura sp. OS1-43 TaxID=604315 RepID=UPI00255AC773|nr:S8 family serine peptidase [Actinomadura sp. OS1-43]MDL4821027.1 S8 family serine peptidase [Actinomadura sp. OS1-43]